MGLGRRDVGGGSTPGGDVMRISERRAALVPLVAVVAVVMVGLALPASAQAMLDLRARYGERFGTPVVPAGDFDRDGTPDLLVGSDQAYARDEPHFVRGGAGILSGKNGRALFVVTGDDYEARTGQPPGPLFGSGCGMVGDFDGDGVCDVLVTHGSPKFLRKIAGFSGRTGAFLFEISDPYRKTDFGDRIVRLGDLLDAQGNLSPDGVPDFAVSAVHNPISVPPPSYPGLVRIYSGASLASGPVHTLVGRFALGEFGASIAVVGDLDGDGRPALAVGSPSGGYVELFDGPGFVSWAVLNTPLRPVARFGHSLANLGDIDGNGTVDLAIGAPDAQRASGRVLVVSLDPLGPSFVTQIDLFDSRQNSAFGVSVAGLPVDPLTGRGLLDLDHDGTPDPFLDLDRDGLVDYLVCASRYDNFTTSTGAGAVFLVPGTGARFELARDPIHQGPTDSLSYAYLPRRWPRAEEWFGSRLTVLGNPAGESQARIALGTPRDDGFRGSLAVLRPPMLRFDDDTFSPANDLVGTSRRLEIDFGPRFAGRRFHVLGSSTGASPGQSVNGLSIPLNDDGPGGLWQHTLAGAAGGSPLGFSQLTGVLDALGRATITVSVTGTTLGHPWFATLRQHYTVVLLKQGTSGAFAQVSAPTALDIQ
jgi:hypothetical protein